MKIKNVQLIKSGIGYNKEYRASYNKYRVLVDGKPIEDIYTKEELKNLSYWAPRSELMGMSCWGTSQSFEAQLALSSFLKMGQRKGEEWGDYTRRIQKIIIVL